MKYHWRFAPFLLIPFALLLLGPLWPGGVARGHGDEQHGARKDATHLEQMQQLKAQIPEEYRLMDRTPVTPTRQSLARGKELYQQHCAVCHGREGRGDGPAAAGMNPSPASFLDLEHSSIYGPGEKFWIVGHGAPATGMPAFRAIEPLDRWHLVNHIFSLQQQGEKR